MAEVIYSPVNDAGVTINGAEFQTTDAQMIGKTAGLADDRVLAELLRMVPTDGTNVYKAILPFAVHVPPVSGTTPIAKATVSPSGSANGSIVVSPFRAIVGTRTADTVSHLDNWRDIRSTVFVGESANGTHPIALAPNLDTVHARWDLVYAVFNIDAPGATVTRRIKSPSDSTLSAMLVHNQIVQGIVIAVVTGTAATTPAIPALPPDSGNTYNVPLAVVRVLPSFSSGSTLLTTDVRDFINGAGGVSSAADLAKAGGGFSVRPADSNNNGPGAPSAGAFSWQPTGSVGRPGLFLPPQMVGGEVRILAIQLQEDSNGGASHPHEGPVDSSVDWRNRFFLGVVQSGSPVGPTYAQNLQEAYLSGGVSHIIPSPKDSTGNLTIQHGQSFAATFGKPAGYRLVLEITSAEDALFAHVFYLYVHPTSGALMVAYPAGRPAVTLFIWLFATSQYPNT